MARTRPDFLSPPPDATATPDTGTPDTARDAAPDDAGDIAGDAAPARDRAAAPAPVDAADTARARADARRVADTAARAADTAPAAGDTDTVCSPKPDESKPASFGEIFAGLAALPAYMVGSTVRTLWRSTLEAPVYWTARGWFRLMGGGLEALGLPHKWASEKVMQKPPWKERGDWPFVGPLAHLFGAMKRGRQWGEAKPGGNKKGEAKSGGNKPKK